MSLRQHGPQRDRLSADQLAVLDWLKVPGRYVNVDWTAHTVVTFTTARRGPDRGPLGLHRPSRTIESLRNHGLVERATLPGQFVISPKGREFAWRPGDPDYERTRP